MGQGTRNEDRHSSLALSLLEPILLTLLNEQPKHGYSLMTEIAATGLNTLHPSVVYRILREMEELGWILSDWNTDQTQGPPRRIYRLTSQGEAVLVNWEQELLRVQDLITNLSLRIKKCRKE